MSRNGIGWGAIVTIDVNLHIGQRLRKRRRILGLAQKDVAEAIGVRFQQIQKYEAGLARISAERLWALSVVLKSPVEHFFQGLELDAHEPSATAKSFDSEAV